MHEASQVLPSFLRATSQMQPVEMCCAGPCWQTGANLHIVSNQNVWMSHNYVPFCYSTDPRLTPDFEEVAKSSVESTLATNMYDMVWATAIAFAHASRAGYPGTEPPDEW